MMSSPALQPFSEPTPPAPPAPRRTPEPWPAATRVAFRFAFVFWLLTLLPWFLELPPRLDELILGWHYRAIAWSAHHLLGMTRELVIDNNGSGDKTIDWLWVGMTIALSLAATLVWSLLARRRRYDGLYEALRIFVRYGLITAMFGYGIPKLFRGQFPEPPVQLLMDPYGVHSPMNLLWTFMGHSTAYIFFAGFGETLGAVLLCFRRTATLGALVVAGVMSNVVMLNFCYDVPVKIFSSTLLLGALFLLVPEARRLADLFVFNRPTAPAQLKLELPRPWMRRARAVAKVLLLGGALAFDGYGVHQQMQWLHAKTSFIDGYWYVDKLVRDGVDEPRLANVGDRWRGVVFGWGSFAAQQMDDDKKLLFGYSEDEARKELTLTPPDAPPDTKQTFTLVEKRQDRDHVVLSGKVDGKQLELTLRRQDPQKLLLNARGFHFVNEVPFNR